nr:hypothetical protein [Secundilactobacillus kimchicus]
MLLGTIGLILCGLIIIGIPETLTIAQRQTGPLFDIYKSFGQLLKTPQFTGYIIVTGVVYGSLFSYIAASTFVYQNLFGLSAQAFSLIYALNGLGIVIGSALPGRLNQISAKRQVQVSLSISVLVGGLLLVGANVHFPLVAVAGSSSCSS